MVNLSKPILIDFGHNTQLLIKRLGPVGESAAGTFLPLDFDVVQKGRLSRRQLRMKLQRLLNNLLRMIIAQNTPNPSRRVLRAAANARTWNAKHLQFPGS